MNGTPVIKKYTDEDIAGQRLMVGFNGEKLTDSARKYIDTFRIGGFILFRQNIKDPDQLNALCRDAQEYAASCGLPPLFISIDQEGGEVARLKSPFYTQFPGNPAMKTIEDAIAFADITAKELSGSGVNMDLAPVMDVAPEGVDSIMSNRVFGTDPKWVSHMGSAVIRRLQENNIMAVAKHFPGIGRTTLDSHLSMPVLDNEKDQFESFDFLPFKSAIENDVTGIMLSHILYSKIDPIWPASLSPAIAKDLLRTTMGYKGLVLTDDLDMGAITERYDIHTAIRQTVASDIDIVLICHENPKIEMAFQEFVRLTGESHDNRSMAVSCFERIIKTKKRYLY